VQGSAAGLWAAVIVPVPIAKTPDDGRIYRRISGTRCSIDRLAVNLGLVGSQK